MGSKINLFVFGLFCAIAQTRSAEQSVFALNFTDVDGHTVSTTDGRVLIFVICTSSDVDKARLVGDRVPGYCLGNPLYRQITLIAFEKTPNRATQAIMGALARHRLNVEADRLRPVYKEKNLFSDPRQDVCAVLDFDGAIREKLGAPENPPIFQVLVLGRKGELFQRWTELPTAEQLAAVMK